ncbi:hypothetical protein M514_23094 [Trichuris suis]|uniref:Uncharacterized protein n=1 Tax=Trichuris suis TaxID=68888 RepID=A0A085N5M5_9BILA|nr:hypothetical protein M514_23094 [Trichuris suis]
MVEPKVEEEVRLVESRVDVEVRESQDVKVVVPDVQEEVAACDCDDDVEVAALLLCALRGSCDCQNRLNQVFY